MKTNKIFYSFIIIICTTVSLSYAQYGGYGGGYGGYGGGYGGYGRGYGSGLPRADFGNTPRKPETVDQEAENESKWLKKKLKLTDEQFLKVDDLVLEYAIKRSMLKENAMKMAKNEQVRNKVVVQFRQDIVNLQNEKEELLKKVFTPEQIVIYEEKKKNIPYYIDPAIAKMDSTKTN